jgi:hypothetical protein
VFVQADGADLIATAFEAALRIIERYAFEKEEPDPSRIENQREHGRVAVERGEPDPQKLAALKDQLFRAGEAFAELFQPCSRCCGDLRRVPVDRLFEIGCLACH